MDFDWTQFRGELDWLPARTIYVTRHGSRAYGTSVPGSDLDLRGIAIPPREVLLGYRSTFEQAQSSDPDFTVFDLRKFLTLASASNPNALELLFTEPDDHLVVTPQAERLLAARSLFLSRKAKHTFSGYATAQLRRIQVHHRWLKDPPLAPPTRAELGLPERTVIPADQLAAAEAAIKKQLDAWSWHELEHVDAATKQAIQDELGRRLGAITGWSWVETAERTRTAAARTIGLDENFIQLLDLERRHASRLREWQQFQEWKRTRNPARAALEARFGYDVKHGMHLVRLLRMAREILVEGVVRVRRPDADELLAIRAGAWPYEDLLAWAERQDRELEELATISPLPKVPDAGAIDRLCVELVASML